MRRMMPRPLRYRDVRISKRDRDVQKTPRDRLETETFETETTTLLRRTWLARLSLRWNCNRVNLLRPWITQVKVRGKEVVVLPQLMLNRILAVLESDTDLATYLKYELAPQPPSLFDDWLFIEKNIKSCTGITSVITAPTRAGWLTPRKIQFRSLMGSPSPQRLSVVWPCLSATYANICQTYVSHILTHYVLAATVVFDDYADLTSTKSE